MQRVVVLIVCLAGCRLGFDQLGGGDGGGDDAPGGDGGGADGGGGGDGGGDTDGGADGAMVTCPGNYTMLVGAPTTSRYRTVNNSEGWDAAQAACLSDGHHLAIPDDENELTALYTALVTQNIWIGVTDRITEGTYLRVIGGVQSYLPWSPGEPDPEDCIFIDGLSALLVAQDCGSGRRYICECDGALTDPASY
ncbi:MAG: C-type lectin domain-containing protein [Kofleriaceae bacterium]